LFIDFAESRGILEGLKIDLAEKVDKSSDFIEAFIERLGKDPGPQKNKGDGRL